jgi:hypothetical protein
MTPDALVLEAAKSLTKALSSTPPAFVSYTVEASLHAPRYRRDTMNYTTVVVLRTADGVAKIRTEGKTRDEPSAFPLPPNFNGLADFQIEALVGFPHYLALRPSHITALVGDPAVTPTDRTPDIVVTYLRRYSAAYVGDPEASSVQVHLTPRVEDGGRRQMRISDLYIDRRTSLLTAVEYVGSIGRRLRVIYTGGAAQMRVAEVTYHVDSESLGTIDFTSKYSDPTPSATFELPPR